MYQYQGDQAGRDWVFRYDYIRDPRDHHPASHLQVRGALHTPVLPADKPLERVHFPTRRMSIEAIVRLLIQEFGVPPKRNDTFWRPLLTESTRLFYEIAHETL
jgi:hypothetical protein